MKTTYLFAILACCFFSNTLCAQTSSWQWAKGAGGADIQEEQDAATDKSGNVYVTGYYGGATISFGNIVLQNNISPRNVFFIAKYSSTGNVLWAKSANPFQSTGCAIATDHDGNVYVSGNFQSDTVAFDSTHVLINHSPTKSFVVKYDSLGNVMGVFAAIGSFLYDVNSIVSDGSNFYVSGSYTNSLNLGNFTLSSLGMTRSGFMAKYSSTGNVIWAKSIETVDSTTLFCNNISIDGHNHLYVAGNSYGRGINAGGVISPGVGRYNVFAAKYDTAGNIIWIRSGGGDFNEVPKDIVADEAGNVYMTGLYYGDSISFGPYTFHSSNHTQSFQYSDFFLVKFDSSGTVVKARTAGEVNNLNAGYSLAADAANHIYLTGGFAHTFTFDSTILAAPAASKDAMFLLVLGEDGKVICSDVQRSGGDDQNTIVLDGQGSAYVGGDFEDSLFAPDGHGLTLVGTENIFVAKYTCSIVNTGLGETTTADRVRVYPNPSSGSFYFGGMKKGEAIEVFDLLGQKVSYPQSSVNGQEDYRIDISGHAKGAYLYRITESGNLIQQGKLVLE